MDQKFQIDPSENGLVLDVINRRAQADACGEVYVGVPGRVVAFEGADELLAV